MTLRKKTLIIVGVATLSLILILYVASRWIMLGSFAELEERNVRQSVERVVSVFSSELTALDTVVADWAAWDDTYVFVQDANKEYVQSNLVDGTFSNGRFNLMLFVDSSGEIVFGKAFDLHDNEEVPVPGSLQEYLAEGTLVAHTDTQSSITGILMLPKAPMLIASRPILTSEEEGPILGTLIIGRYLDAAEIERLAEVVHLPLTLRRLDDPQIPPDFHTARSSLSGETPIFVQPLGVDSVAGYALLEDIYGEPCLVLRMEKPRDIYRQGQASLLYFVLSLLVVSLTFGLLTHLFLEKMVLSRLAQLGADVSTIGRSGDLSARVSSTGGDELSSLAGAINGMLVTLERSREKLQESEERYRILFNSGSDLVFVSEATDEGMLGALTEVNYVACQKLGYTREELLTLSASKVLVPGGESEFPALAETLLSEGQVLFEAVAVAKDGTRIPVEISAHLFDLDDQPAILSIARDITERRRAERALRRLVEFEGVLTKLATYFINLPPDEIDHGINQALQAVGELAGADRSYISLLPQDKLRVEYTYEWCAPGIEPRLGELEGSPVQSGSWWMGRLEWFETIYVPLVADLPPDARVAGEPWLLPATQSLVVTPMVSGGSLIGFLGFSSERAERTWEDVEINLLKTMAGMLANALVQKQAEEALRRSEQRFRGVARVTGDWIWEVDAEGRYTYASPVVEQVLGYTPDEVVGRYYYDFFPSDRREGFESQIQKIFGEKEPFISFVSPKLHKGGHTVILETTGLPLTNADGDLLGYRGADRDITEARRLEGSLTAVQVLGRELVLSRDKRQVALATVDAAKLLLRCRVCELWLVDDEARELVCQARAPRGQANERDTLSLDSEWSIVAAVARDGKAIYVPNPQKDSRFADLDPRGRSELCVPLEVKEQVIGVLLAEGGKPDAFDEGEQQLLSTLAGQTALAIENARLYGRVRAGRDRLRALSRRLVEVQETERRHIARELHDEVGQLLTGLKLILEMGMRLPSDAVKANLDEAEALVNEIMARVRKLSLDLRPTMLDDLGLLPALLWHIERYTTQTTVRVAFRHTGLEGRRFAPEVETAAYRIVQEALTNVARHAGVSEAAVRVWCDQDLLSIRVEDQGVGFVPEALLDAGVSTGLSGMHERMALLGGHLAIEAAPGAGVRLTAEIPLISSSKKEGDV